MSAPLHRHPRFAELCDEFRGHPVWFAPWKGTLFRFQTVEFPSPTEILSGIGAERRGGRWNPPGLPAVYGSTSDGTALEECKANDRYYGIETKGPRLLVAVEARLACVLDLTDAGVRRKIGVTLQELAAEDWRKLQEAGKESFTQTLGRAVAEAGGSGILARSAAVRGGVNVVVFPGVCTADRLKVVEGHRLQRLASRTKA